MDRRHVDSAIEIKIAMVKGFETKFSLQEIKRIFERLDSDSSGRINLNEFIIGVRVSELRDMTC